MTRASPIQNAFVTGQMSARLRGRDDLDQYHQGMRQAYNGVCQPHGGFAKRMGTRYVATAKNRTSRTAMIPFEVAAEQQYVIEAGYRYFRFYANAGQIESSPGVPYEIAHTIDEPFDAQTAQNADIMYVVHKDGFPYKLSRTGFAAFAWNKVVFSKGHCPCRPENISTTTLTVSGAGPYTLTFSTDQGFTSGADVGRGVRLIHSTTNTCWYEVTAVVSGTVLTAELKDGVHDATARTDWAMGLFSDTEGPRAIAFHEGRLWYGGARETPDYLVGSVSDDFDNFDPGNGTDADRALAKRVVGAQVNTIVWLNSQNTNLVVGTTGGEFRVFGSDNDILTPTSTVIRPASSRGSRSVPPVLVDSQTLFAQRNGRSIFEFSYMLDKDTYMSRSLSLMAEDIFDTGSISRMVYQQTPDSVLWCLREDGKAVGLTYEPSQKVIGHHVHDFGCELIDAAVIQNPEATEDQLWFCGDYETITYPAGKRTVTTVRYICYMVNSFRPDFDASRSTQAERIRALDDAFYVDCGLSLDLPLDITAITRSNPVLVTSAGHGLTTGDEVRLRVPRIVPMDTVDDGETDYNGHELDNLAVEVTVVTADTFYLQGIDGSTYSEYFEGGTARKTETTISGLDHLEGREVAILADGGVAPRQTVSSGAITLATAASIVHVGLPYVYRGETQRFAQGARLGSGQGQPTKIKRVAAILHNTAAVKFGVGADPDELEEIETRDGSMSMDRPPPLFSGDVEVPVEGGWNVDATVYFENDQPLPCTVVAVMPRIETNER